MWHAFGLALFLLLSGARLLSGPLTPTPVSTATHWFHS